MNKIQRTSFKQLLRQILFLCIPTVFMIYVLIFTTSDYFPLLNHKQHISQTLFFALGILSSCVFYSFKFRFLPSFLILLLLFSGISIFLDNFAVGEFDSFFLSIDFLLFRTLFLFGWVCGWGFSRSRYFPAILSTFLLAGGVIITALSGRIGVWDMVSNFSPIPVYAFYIIFMNELIRNTYEKGSDSWTKPLRGLIVYAAAMTLLLFLTFKIFQPEMKQLEVKWGEQTAQNDNKNSLYEMLADSTIQMKENLSVNDNLNRGNSEDFPLFVTYIDNFFPNSDIPNPLYFVTEYLTLFDEYTETFERDEKMPYNDLFSPDPSTIPLYFAETDRTVIDSGMSQIYRKVVDVEVYKISLSPNEFTAPSTAFYCQPIAVKNDERAKYSSAYRAKMWVSELNSAYFVYNNIGRNWEFQQFQEQRFSLLREVEDFSEVDRNFVDYYTQYPENEAYDTIKKIAHQIIEDAEAETPIDKVLAIRDYFMQTDELGKPLYSYSDVATTVPPGSRILNFVLNEHFGNCTYYAGATYLMLRACGIPARIATGYAIVDRSSNNKGWYWVYNKQAHAWVQAFFPGYGWLDFDTTFGDSEQEEAPGTDGTPPLDPQKAWFAGNGEVLSVDTIRQMIRFNLEKMMYFDTEYVLDSPFELLLDLSLAEILKDSVQIKLSAVNKGEKGLAISFTQTEELEDFEFMPADYILKNLPDPIPVDEFRVHIESKKKEKASDTSKAKTESSSKNSTLKTIIIFLLLILLLTIIVLSVPYIIFTVYSRKAKLITQPNKEAYYPYRAAMFLLYQMGYPRKDLTPLQFASKVVDPEFRTSFEAFVATYLKVKYAGQELTNEDSQRILTFYKPFEQSIRNKISFKKRLFKFINIYNTLEFFTKQESQN